MVQQTTTDVAQEGQEGASEVTIPVETQEPAPEPTIEELKTTIAALQAEKKNLSRALTRKEYEAKGKEVSELKEEFSQLKEALKTMARYTLKDIPAEEIENPAETAFSQMEKVLAPKAKPPVREEPPEVQQVREKIAQLMGDNGKVKPEYRSTYLTVKGFWEEGDLESCNDELDKVLKPKPPEKKAPIPGVGVDRVTGSGNINKVFTKKEIAYMADNLSDDEWKKMRPILEQADREGRIK